MARKVKNKTRRQNNEGSIFQRKDGRWVGAITLGYNDEGVQKKKSVYGNSKMEVAKKLTELTSKISSNNYEYIENTSFGEIMNEWMLVFKRQLVSPRTFEHQYSKFRLHIRSQIGEMKVDEINTLTIQKLLNNMLEKGLGMDTVRKTKNLLNQFFEYAISTKLANDNPTLKAKVRSSERKDYDSENKYKAIPSEIREKFITALDSHEFLKPLCFSMLFGGLRTGEVLALKWKNIDFNKRTISIQNSVTVVPKYDSDGKILERITVIGSTKTACSVRVVPIPQKLYSALIKHRENQKMKGYENNITLTTPDSFVFGNSDGSVRSYTGTRSIFERFLKTHKLDNYGIHFHGLRHTYSNILFENNQNPKMIQNLLGHKSVKTTLVTYNSVDSSYYDKATEVFDKEFEESNPQDEDEDGTETFISSLTETQRENLMRMLADNKKERDRKSKQKEDDFDM